MLTKKDLISQIEKLGLPSGKPLIVHTSLKAIGEIDGGAETLLEALISVVADKNGLLCIPTHTWDTLVMDLGNPTSNIGALPTVASAHPMGIRSMHPTHSVTVFGGSERAKKFVENEGNVDTPTNPDGCYGNIIKENGYALLIGVDQRKNTIIHCIEEMLSVKNRLTLDMIEAKIIHKNGKTEKRKLHWFDDTASSDVSMNFGKFEPAFRHYNCIEDRLLGNAKTQLCDISKMKKVMEIIYERAGGTELLSNDLPSDTKLYI